MGIKIGNTNITRMYIHVYETVHVIGVTLDKNFIVLTTVGQTEQLTATITPANADDQTVTWSSSDTTVATVDQNGLVTCVTPGTATITVTTNDGGHTASCGVYGTNTLFRYIKWEITANKQATSGWTVTQMSEFELCDTNGTKMSRPAGISISANILGPSGERVDKIIDGYISTKYCPNGSLPVIITIDLGTQIDFATYCKYKWYTANDAPERDPITRTLSLSNDNSNWEVVSTVTNATITSSRYALAGTWNITV